LAVFDKISLKFFRIIANLCCFLDRVKKSLPKICEILDENLKNLNFFRNFKHFQNSKHFQNFKDFLKAPLVILMALSF